MGEELDNEDDESDIDDNHEGVENGMTESDKILLLSVLIIGSLCIICSALIFMTFCFVGGKKRSDGLTDMEWCWYAGTMGKEAGHMLVGDETDDEDIAYDETLNECTIIGSMASSEPDAIVTV